MHIFKCITFRQPFPCTKLCIAEKAETLSENSEYVLKHGTSRKQLMYDSTSGTAESHPRTSDNGNGNGLKQVATDSMNVCRSPRGHASSKCPRYNPYTSKPLQSSSGPTKDSEDPHNSSGGIVSDSDLANLAAPNSAQKSRKSGEENLIPSYLFDKTDTDIKTSTPVKEEGSDEMKKTKMLFDKKVKNENFDASSEQRRRCKMAKIQTS